jgi:hypothetical protein
VVEIVRAAEIVPVEIVRVAEIADRATTVAIKMRDPS